jgi:hypothetical protein
VWWLFAEVVAYKEHAEESVWLKEDERVGDNRAIEEQVVQTWIKQFQRTKYKDKSLHFKELLPLKLLPSQLQNQQENHEQEANERVWYHKHLSYALPCRVTCTRNSHLYKAFCYVYHYLNIFI